MLHLLQFFSDVETENPDAEKFSAYVLETAGEGNFRKEEVTLYGVQEDSRYLDMPMQEGDVFISSACADKYGLGAGDTITLVMPNGKAVSRAVKSVSAAGADEQTQESSAPLPPDLDAAQNSAAVKPLELDNQTLQKGDLSVLDGQWRSRSGLIDATTGKPVNIDYSFKNGQGQATVTRSDGSKCVGATQGSIASGALQIGSGQAKCPDGSTYDMPKVVCAPDKDGKTSCKGDYGDAKSSFNINLFK